MKGKLGALAMAASALFLGRPLAQSVAPSGPPEVTVLPKPGVGGSSPSRDAFQVKDLRQIVTS